MRFYFNITIELASAGISLLAGIEAYHLLRGRFFITTSYSRLAMSYGERYIRRYGDIKYHTLPRARDEVSAANSSEKYDSFHAAKVSMQLADAVFSRS